MLGNMRTIQLYRFAQHTTNIICNYFFRKGFKNLTVVKSLIV